MDPVAAPAGRNNGEGIHNRQSVPGYPTSAKPTRLWPLMTIPAQTKRYLQLLKLAASGSETAVSEAMRDFSLTQIEKACRYGKRLGKHVLLTV
jgi:hypothetical protein